MESQYLWLLLVTKSQLLPSNTVVSAYILCWGNTAFQLEISEQKDGAFPQPDLGLPWILGMNPRSRTLKDQTYQGDHLVRYINVFSLCCTSETYTTFYVNCNWIKKQINFFKREPLNEVPFYAYHLLPSFSSSPLEEWIHMADTKAVPLQYIFAYSTTPSAWELGSEVTPQLLLPWRILIGLPLQPCWLFRDNVITVPP